MNDGKYTRTATGGPSSLTPSTTAPQSGDIDTKGKGQDMGPVILGYQRAAFDYGPDTKSAHNHLVPDWLSAATCEPLSNSRYLPFPIATSTRTIAGVHRSYLVVAPGLARSVESIVPVYRAAWSADTGDHRHRRIFGRYSSSWEPKATFARSATYFNELIAHLWTNGIEISPEQSLQWWADCLRTDLVVGLQKAKAQQGTLLMGTNEDVEMLKDDSDSSVIHLVTKPKGTASLQGMRRLLRITSDRSAYVSPSDTAMYPEDCAYIITRGSLTQAGIPQLGFALALPKEPEDIKHVPGLVFTALLPSVNGANSLWDKLSAQACSAYTSMAQDEEFPDAAVAAVRRKYHGVDPANLSDEHRIYLLEGMVNSLLEDVIEHHMRQGEFHDSYYNRPRVGSFSHWGVSSNNLGDGLVSATSLNRPAGSSAEFRQILSQMRQPSSDLPPAYEEVVSESTLANDVRPSSSESPPGWLRKLSCFK